MGVALELDARRLEDHKVKNNDMRPRYGLKPCCGIIPSYDNWYRYDTGFHGQAFYCEECGRVEGVIGGSVDVAARQWNKELIGTPDLPEGFVDCVLHWEEVFMGGYRDRGKIEFAAVNSDNLQFLSWNGAVLSLPKIPKSKPLIIHMWGMDINQCTVYTKNGKWDLIMKDIFSKLTSCIGGRRT